LKRPSHLILKLNWRGPQFKKKEGQGNVITESFSLPPIPEGGCPFSPWGQSRHWGWWECENPLLCEVKTPSSCR
jgi:hypothetical protein